MTRQAPSPTENEAPDHRGEQPRNSADDWREEASRQARALNVAPPEQRLFGEFRRKMATGEALSAALQKLAEAVRFSGRLTITFHQGKVTKTVMEEAYFRGRQPA
jgi:hypothetical protein